MPSTPSTVVSFTVRRPTPVSRPSSSGPESDSAFKLPALPRHVAASTRSSATGSPLAGSPRAYSSREDSGDDGETGIVFVNGSIADNASHRTDSSDEDDLVTSSKSADRQRFHKKKAVQAAPLVIPARPNPDWREAARKRRAGCARVQRQTFRATPSFVPDSALTATGADGSVGGLGTRGSINTGPQLSGLQIKKRVNVGVEGDGAGMMKAASVVSVDQSTTEAVEETEDQRALREILADVPTSEDYERVPVSAFGAAMLRGMGWTDDAVASKSDKRSKNGLTGLYLPQARPALLGIGAKEREPEDDGSGKKKKGRDMRYVPVAKKESERGGNESSRSGTFSRRSSCSPPRRERNDRVAERDRSAYDDRERRKVLEY